MNVLDQELAYWDHYEEWAEIPTHEVLDRARNWLGEKMPRERTTSLCWGAARLGNVVFRDNRCVGVLDWETTLSG